MSGDVQATLFQVPLATDVRTVALSEIRPGVANMVMRSVGKVGVLQALLLRPSREAPFVYEIVDGNRRDFSARHYGLTEVPALITDGTGAQIAAARALANTARSSNPVQEARAWRAVMDEGLYADVNALARDLGVNVATVKQRLRLSLLPDEVLSGVEAGVIAEGTAEKLANLDATYKNRALNAYRAAVASGERFTDLHLKEVRVRRSGDMAHSALGALAALPVPPEVTPLLTVSPAEVLAEEVRRLAEARGVPLGDLLAALGGAAAPEPPQPAPPIVRGRVSLGGR